MFSENISKSDRVVNADFTATGTVMGILRDCGNVVIDADDGFIDLSEYGEWLRVPTPSESKKFLNESRTYNRRVSLNEAKVAIKSLWVKLKVVLEGHQNVNHEAKADFDEARNLYAGIL